jgi:hypothetical protein
VQSRCSREGGCFGMGPASKVTLRSFFAPAPLLGPTRLRSAKLVASSRPMPQGLPKRRWVSSGTCFQCDAPRGSGDFILGALGAQKNAGEQTLSLSPGDHFFHAGPQKGAGFGRLALVFLRRVLVFCGLRPRACSGFFAACPSFFAASGRELALFFATSGGELAPVFCGLWPRLALVLRPPAEFSLWFLVSRRRHVAPASRSPRKQLGLARIAPC